MLPFTCSYINIDSRVGWFLLSMTDVPVGLWLYQSCVLIFLLKQIRSCPSLFYANIGNLLIDVKDFFEIYFVVVALTRK